MTIKKIFCLLTFLTFISSMNATLTSTPDPDFSKPTEQSEEQLRLLAGALASGDSKEAARAAILYQALISAKDPDSIGQAISTINSVADDARVTPPVKALLNLDIASTYYDLYNGRRWVYDRRKQPLAPLPDDYNLWSGEQFRHVIDEYIDKALSQSRDLKNTPMAEYGRICGLTDKKDLVFFPTLYDFVAYGSINIINSNDRSTYLFSTGLLTPIDIYVKDKFTYQAPSAQRILKLYQSLLELHRDDPAPLIYADVARINYISQHLDNNSEYFSQDAFGGIVYDEHRLTKAYSLLIDLYKKYAETPYAAEALVSAGHKLSYKSEAKAVSEFCDMARAHLKAFPSYGSNGCLANMVNDLVQPRVFVEHPTTVVPGDKMTITVSNYNTPNFELKVYKVPYTWKSDDYSYNFRNGSQPKLIKSIAFKASGKAPFHTVADTVVAFDSPGCYILVPAYPGNAKGQDNNRYSYIRCTNLSIGTASFGNDQWGMVVNPMTGAPVADAEIVYKGNATPSPASKPIKTDREGMARIGSDRGQYYVKKGTDIFASPTSVWRSRSESGRSYNICALTDLAIYRPGDTVSWNIVTQSYSLGSARVEPDAKVKAILYDANNMPLDTAETSTDEWGRAEGQFNLPKTGLTGRYSIRFSLTEEGKSKYSGGYAGFTVSDYKLPTYFIEVTDILRDSPQKGDVTLKGRTATYSGFPVALAKISLDLQYSSRIWGVWRGVGSGATSFYSTEVTTDDDGLFTITLPEGLLKSAPIADPIFSAMLTSVSPTGESRSTSKAFTQGKPYMLSTDIPQTIDISSPVGLGVKMTDLSGRAIDAEIRYTLMDADKREVASGIISTASPKAYLAAVASGQYSISFCPVDSALADKTAPQPCTLYRPTDKACPVKDAVLWVPVREQLLPASRRASVLFGVTAAENHVHYAVYTDTTLIEQGWLDRPAGMHRFEYTLPGGVSSANVVLSCTSRYRNEQAKVKLTTPEADKSVKLSIESFRDRLTPGEEETWTLRVTDSKGTGIKAPVALDMYAKPLDDLASRPFTINPRFGQTMFYSLSDMVYNGTATEILTRRFKGENCRTVQLPQFFIAMPPFNITNITSGVRVRGYGVHVVNEMKMAKSEAAMDAEEEIHTTEEVYITGSTSFGAADAIEDSADGGSRSEETAGSETAAPAGADSFDYRMPETPLAFYHPSLTTDADGTLKFSFTVPNAITTWNLCAYTYSSDMAVDRLTREAIASKPVMVQPNLPRFLRNGDRVCIEASVMNNNDYIQAVVSNVEIFNPATGKTLYSQVYMDTIQPLKSAKISTWVDAPADANMIGYRVKSTTGNFTDGEQAIIPVLPSVEPVIETTPFYIPADAGEFSVKLPKMPKDALVTLQFCENPTWYVATALPGLRSGKPNSALEAAASIFSAAIAKGILRTDPDIADAIRTWNSSQKDDSTLVSMLSRNADLKTVLLNSTPWVMDAQSQTERMERLALLFDDENISDTYDNAVKKLAELTCSDGGWAWIGQQKESSMWITENVLLMMGRLKRLGYLPDNKQLHDMLDKAVGYYDAQTAKTFKKSPDYTSPLFVLTRGYYPEKKMSATIKNFVNNTLGVESREWKTRSLPQKAIDAIILNGNGYPTVAKEIVASIKDYSVYKPEAGTWWPSLDDMTVWSMGKISATSIILDAFSDVVPGSPEIDRIRQWLILQKEAKDWGTSVSTSDAIASILLSGSKWTRPAQGATVAVNGRTVAVGEVDSLLGYFRENISQYKPSSAKLTVKNLGNTPSWGAVYAQYRDRMTDIKAASVPDLSIEKTIYRRVNTESGVKWEAADRLNTGDLVQINLTVIVGRDMDYVAIVDDRGACLEPVEQTPEPIYAEGICFYRENRDSATNMFITHLPKGTYRLSYEMYVNNAGTFSAGIASIQSQYAPALSAHSSGNILTVNQ